MDIPCKMRGNVQEITFCAQTLPNFVIPYIIVTNVNFFEAGLSMAFSSVQFLFVFLPLALAVYWLCPKRLRNIVLGAFSLLFLPGRG